MGGLGLAAGVHPTQIGRSPRGEKQRQIVELLAFLARPNDADDPAAMIRNASWLKEAFGKRGFFSGTFV